MTFDVMRIPEELKRRDQWVCWKKEIRAEKETKIPYIANTQNKATSTNPKTWRRYEQVLESVRKGLHDGIGFCFRHDPYCILDLDHCINPDTKEIESWACNIIQKLNSYSETSQSGLGVHVIVRAALPEHKGKRKGNFEIYDSGRYACMTGNVLKNYPITIEERQTEIDQICSEIFGKPEPEQKLSQRKPSTSNLSNQEIIERASKAKNGKKFTDLMAGQWQGNYTSQSEADIALCCALAFWTPDPDQIDKLFRQSGLYRDKWDRADYRNDTINKALELTPEHYTPGTQSNHRQQAKAEPSGPKDKSNNQKTSEFDKYKTELQSILSKHDLNTNEGKKSALRESESYIKSITNPSITSKLWNIVNKELNLTDVERDIELTFKSAEDLEKMDLPEISWIVPGIIPEGLTILAGKPKMGKSLLALGLAVAISSGGKAFSSIDLFEHQGSVLYLALEDNDRRMKQRLTKLCMGEKFPKNLIYTTEIKRGTEGVKSIRAWLEKNKEDARLVVIDTFVSFRGKASSKMTSEYERDSNDMQSIQRLAGEFGIGIIIIHHLRKAIAEDDFDTISGTLGLTGKADTNLILKRTRGEADAILKGTGRDLDEDIDVALKFDPSIAGWILLGNAGDYLMSKERQDIITILKTANEPLSPKQIADNLGKNPSTIRVLLSKMVLDGTLKQIGYAKYIIKS